MIREPLLESAKLRMNLRMIALLLMLVVVTSSYQASVLTYASANNQQNASTAADPTHLVNLSVFATENDCTYLIFTDETTTFVEDCNTGGIVSSGTDAATQINNAIFTLKDGGLIHVRTGTYTLTAPIVGTVDGVTFEGEGPGTVFNVNVGFSGSIVVAEGSNWVLRNFKIDGTNQVRRHSTAGIYVTGNNETVMGTDIFGTDHAGIEDARYGCGGKCGYGVKILNNVITNGYDDGIIVSGSNVLVSGNVVDTTTNHNGISLVSPQNVSVIGNNINNTNCGIALENLGYGWGPAKFITITNNMIRNSRFFGFWIFSGDGDSGDNVTFNENMIINPKTGGIELDSGTDNLISNNVVANSSARGIYVLGIAKFLTITGNTVASPKANGIWMSTDVHDCIVDNNTITNPAGNAILLATNDRVTVTRNEIYYPTSSSPVAGIQVDGGNDITVRSNHVRVTGKSRTGIDLLGVSSFTIAANTITGSGQSGVSQLTAGIMVSNSTSGIISSNLILGDAISGILLGNESKTVVVGNSVNLAANCIRETTNGSDYNILSDNVLNNCGTGLSYIGPHDVATNNTGLNHGPIQSSVIVTQNQVSTSSLSSQELLLASAGVIAAALCVALLTKIKQRQPQKPHRRRKVPPRRKARKNR
jgi:parallel beta-helix repeat protein